MQAKRKRSGASDERILSSTNHHGTYQKSDHWSMSEDDAETDLGCTEEQFNEYIQTRFIQRAREEGLFELAQVISS